MNIASVYFIYFLIYSFLGWVCETAFCFIVDKELVNRGFLKGPFCPVYGFGALSVILVLTPLSNNIIILYLSAMLFTSAIEYATGFLLETIFSLKWWDYSKYRFNIKGRVCLLNSTLFGILSLILIKMVHPIVAELIRNTPNDIIIWIFCISIMYILVDATITTYKVLQLGGKLKEIHLLIEEIKEKSEVYREIFQQNISKFDELIDQDNEKSIFVKEQVNKLKSKLESVIIKNKSNSRRIIKAFPNIQSLKYQYSFDKLKEELRRIRKR